MIHLHLRFIPSAARMIAPLFSALSGKVEGLLGVTDPGTRTFKLDMGGRETVTVG